VADRSGRSPRADRSSPPAPDRPPVHRGPGSAGKCSARQAGTPRSTGRATPVVGTVAPVHRRARRAAEPAAGRGSIAGRCSARRPARPGHHDRTDTARPDRGRRTFGPNERQHQTSQLPGRGRARLRTTRAVVSGSARRASAATVGRRRICHTIRRARPPNSSSAPVRPRSRNRTQNRPDATWSPRLGSPLPRCRGVRQYE